MKARWLGHACFLLTSDSGIRVITDPYKKEGNGLNYGDVNETADVVLISHEHADHNNPSAVRGNPQIIKGPGSKQAKGILFKGIATFHDEAGGKKRGSNTVFTFEMDDVRVCHLGDLGHELSNKELSEIGKVDVLFVPVGGFYTMEPAVASRVAARLSPKVIIPMHFKTAKVDTNVFGAITGAEEFLKGKSNVERKDSSEIELKAGNLPSSTLVIVLKPAL